MDYYTIVTNFIADNWDKIITIILSGTALCISVKSWLKNRAVYQIEAFTVRQVRGRADDTVHFDSMKIINKKLISTKYTILNITTRESDGDFQILLGRIKK